MCVHPLPHTQICTLAHTIPTLAVHAGEAVAARKSSDPIPEEECQLHDKECMLFASTAITNGACTAVVNSTGMASEIGKIQEQIQEAAEEEEDTPLKKKLNAFGEALAQVLGSAFHTPQVEICEGQA